MMKQFFILAMTLFAHLNVIHAQKGDAILGNWINEKKDSKFEIYKTGDTYAGKVTWGKGSETKDVKNPDPKLRNREIIGLTILENFSFDGKDQWKGGSIYDPRQGKTYDCKMKLKNPNTLEVRGYLGVSLFGRTETWSKIN